MNNNNSGSKGILEGLFNSSIKKDTSLQEKKDTNLEKKKDASLEEKKS